MRQLRTHARRGWSALAWGLVCFAGLHVSLNLALPHCLPEVSDPEYGIREASLRQQVTAAPGRPLVVVLGSSRVSCGLAPEVLPPAGSHDREAPLVFNLSLADAGPLVEQLCLRRLLSAGIRPASVVVEVLPAYLARDERVAVAALQASRHPFVLEGRPVETAAPDRSGWQTCLAPTWFTSRAALLERYAACFLPPGQTTGYSYWRRRISPTGWVPVPEGWSRERYEKGLERARQEHGPLLARFQIDPRAGQDLRRLLDLCRREGVAVLGLLWMPEAGDYRGWLSGAGRAALHEYLTGLGSEYGTELIDASAWLPDDAFADGHHLLPHGARTFTERFWREVLRPRWHGDTVAARP